MKMLTASLAPAFLVGAFFLILSTIPASAQGRMVWDRIRNLQPIDVEEPTDQPTPPVVLNPVVVFSDITEVSGLARDFGIETPTLGSMSEIFAGGLAAGDYDNDGDIDLYLVAGDASPNQLFENRGNNQFVDVAPEVGLAKVHKGSGPTFADIDGDGDLDLFVGGIEGHPNYVLRNNDGIFEDITSISGIHITAPNTISAAFGDWDLDGDLDMFAAHWGTAKAPDTQHLWINDGAGKFHSGSIETGIAESIIVEHADGGMPGWTNVDYTFAPNFADIDSDGFPDLLVTGDFGTSQVYHNQGDGTFARVTDPSVIIDENGMGASVGDYDNDGDLDWFVTAIFNVSQAGRVISIGNRLYRNLGDGNFEDVTLAAGVSRGGWGWGSSFTDFDNDGDLDIFHTNGWVEKGTGIGNFVADPVKLFLNNGDGTFSDSAAAAKLFDNGRGSGVACFDADRDGDQDIVLTNNEGRSVVFYRNDTTGAGHYLNVALKGPAPNTAGIGARIYVSHGETEQMREMAIGSNFASHNPAEAHFGLGTAEHVSLRIIWPDGTVTEKDNVTANQRLVIPHSSLESN